MYIVAGMSYEHRSMQRDDLTNVRWAKDTCKPNSR